MARVLVFLPCLTYGGAERQGLILAQHLASDGHQVTVWGFPAPFNRAPLKADLDASTIPWRELPRWPALDWRFSRAPKSPRWLRERYRGWPEQLAALRATLPAERFDCVVPFTFWPCLVATRYRRRLTSGQVYWNHRGGDDDAGVDYSPFLIREIKKNRPVFMANSEGGRAFLQRVFRLDPNRIAVVPNAFVPETEFSAAEIDLRRADDTIKLVQVANFFPEKDIETLVGAIWHLRDHRPRVELHLAGYFPDPARETRFKSLCAALGLGSSVVHYGNVSRAQVTQLLRESNIGVLSSNSEGAPNAVMEYMYFCLPVVGTAIPGIRGVLGQGNEPWLFPKGDAEALAAKIGALASNAELRHSLGLLNRRRVEEAFSPKRVLPEWSKLLGLSP